MNKTTWENAIIRTENAIKRYNAELDKATRRNDQMWMEEIQIRTAQMKNFRNLLDAVRPGANHG